VTHLLGRVRRIVTALAALAAAGVVVFFARTRRRGSPMAGAG
jgi:hypothetical protein